jgi:hypothetical protein
LKNAIHTAFDARISRASQIDNIRLQLAESLRFMNLLSLKLTSEGGLQIEIASGLVLVLLVFLIGMVYFRRRQFFGKTSYFEVNEAEIGIGSGKLKLKANIEDIQIVFKF